MSAYILFKCQCFIFLNFGDGGLVFTISQVRAQEVCRDSNYFMIFIPIVKLKTGILNLCAFIVHHLLHY